MPNRNDFLNYFNSLDSMIERFHRQLVAVKNRRPDDMREVLVSRTFACAAAIQLHAAFSSTQPMSWKKTLSVAVSASRALDIIDVNQYRHLDPVIAVSPERSLSVLGGVHVADTCIYAPDSVVDHMQRFNCGDGPGQTRRDARSGRFGRRHFEPGQDHGNDGRPVYDMPPHGSVCVVLCVMACD